MELDIAVIKDWKSSLDKHLIIDLHHGNDEQGKLLKKFCDSIERHAGIVNVHTHKVMEGDSSHIRINQQIKYYAVPGEKELLPFLDLLSGKAAAHVPREISDQAILVDIPCAIDIFIGQQCPFCPDAVRKIAPLAIFNPKITVRVIDGLLYPELSEKYDIRSVPTVVSCDGFRWSGSIPVNDILAAMVTRDPASLGADSFENMIADGKALDIARMMIEKNHVFPSFIDVLLHEKWPVRLGAMVAAETLCESRPDIAAMLISPLAERFFEVDDNIKGDIIQVLSEIRNRNASEFLSKIVKSDVSEEVKDMAREARDVIIS